MLPSSAHLAQLVERDDVVCELADHAAAAATGSGRFVFLRGEAGSGKTSVIRAVADQLSSGMRVTTGFCDRLSTPVSLGPVLDLLSELNLQCWTATRPESASATAHWTSPPSV